MASRARQKLILAGAALAAVIASAALVHSWTRDTRTKDASSAIPSRATPPGSESSATQAYTGRSVNPAAQKAGPPDPAMQNAAAAGAESAAKAAADLAAR